MQDNEESERWVWVLGDRECWFGLCPECGGSEQTDLPIGVSTLDLVRAERAHKCGPLLPQADLYLDFYGIDDLKRRMGFPEELI